MVGRMGSENFAAFPPDGVALLKQLLTGMTPQEASAWYQEQYQDTVDMDDFLQTLQDLDFIHRIRSRRKEPFSKGERRSLISRLRVRLVRLTGSYEALLQVMAKRESRSPISRLRVRLVRLTGSYEVLPQVMAKKDAFWRLVGRAFFSPLAWALYAALFGYCVFLMVQYPYLLPHYQQIFFSPSYTVIELGLFLGGFFPIFFHEWFHMLAGRRLGIPSRLSIGRRLYFVVFETDLTGLWSVPAKARYLPFLAGMVADILFFSLMTIIADLTHVPGDPYSFPSAFCLAMSYATVLRFLWQFYFYLRTDIYYVIITALRCINLHETTKQYLRNRFYRLIGRPDKMQDESLWSSRDRRFAPWYAPVFLLGYAFSIGLSLFVGIPVTYSYLSGVFNHLLYSTPLSSTFWDASIFLSLNVNSAEHCWFSLCQRYQNT